MDTAARRRWFAWLCGGSAFIGWTLQLCTGDLYAVVTGVLLWSAIITVLRITGRTM